MNNSFAPFSVEQVSPPNLAIYAERYPEYLQHFRLYLDFIKVHNAESTIAPRGSRPRNCPKILVPDTRNNCLRVVNASWTKASSAIRQAVSSNNNDSRDNEEKVALEEEMPVQLVDNDRNELCDDDASTPLLHLTDTPPSPISEVSGATVVHAPPETKDCVVPLVAFETVGEHNLGRGTSVLKKSTLAHHLLGTYLTPAAFARAWSDGKITDMNWDKLHDFKSAVDRLRKQQGWEGPLNLPENGEQPPLPARPKSTT